MTTYNLQPKSEYVNNQLNSSLGGPVVADLDPVSQGGIQLSAGLKSLSESNSKKPVNCANTAVIEKQLQSELSGRGGICSREPSRMDGARRSTILAPQPHDYVKYQNSSETRDNILGEGQSPSLCSTVAIPPIMDSIVEESPIPSYLNQANIIVGFDKLRQLLRPRHPYFNSRQGVIVEFRKYKHSEDCETGLLFARVKGQTSYATKYNPYRKYQLARSHSGRTVGQVAGVIEANELDDMRIAAISWTIPADMSESLSKLGEKGRRIFWSCYKRLVNEDMPSILGVPGELGSINNLHIWSTNEPLNPHFHVHSLLFNYCVSGDSFQKWFGKGIDKEYFNPETSQLKHGPVTFSREELIKLKVAWIMRLKSCCKRNKVKSQYFETLDLENMTGVEIAAKIDVHVQYVSWQAGASRHRFINKVSYQRRNWIEDYAIYSNSNPDCADPPEWLEGYENRSRPLGWWCRASDYGGSIKKNGERISPFTGENMLRDGVLGVHGLINESQGNIGGMAMVHGVPVVWKLCQDDLNWLAKMSSVNETLSKFSWNQQQSE